MMMDYGMNLHRRKKRKKEINNNVRFSRNDDVQKTSR